MTGPNRRLIDVARDGMLAPETRCLLFYLAACGEGWHEVPPLTLDRICGGSTARKRAIEQATGEGLIEVRGGNRWMNRQIRHVLEVKKKPTSTDSPVLEEAEMSSSTNPPVLEDGEMSSSRNVEVHESATSTAAAETPIIDVSSQTESSHLPASISHPSSVIEEKRLERRAAKAFAEHGEKLNGCRGSLRDYLAERVPLKAQYGYVMTVLGWIDGLEPGLFQTRDGRTMVDERVKIIAASLNELLATDESTMKAAMGHIRNLKTKVPFVAREWKDRRWGTEPEPRRKRTDGDPTYLARVTCSDCGAQTVERVMKGTDPPKRGTCPQCRARGAPKPAASTNAKALIQQATKGVKTL